MVRMLVCSLLFLGFASGFYLPGVAPKDFEVNEPVELKVNNLDSTVTQLPYDYYSLPFCQPESISEASENLGEIMTGESIKTSPYEIFMNKIESCKEVCTQKYTQEDLKQFEEKIRQKYSVNWIVDNIPSATVYEVVTQDENGNTISKELIAEKGFALGLIKDNKAYLNNHVRISLDYHMEVGREGYRIVGFEVVPFSVDYSQGVQCDVLHPIKDSSTPVLVSGLQSQTIKFTYDVMWNPSPVKWASRWDIYLKSVNSEVHWFVISNSICLVLFLSALIATILVRALKRDLTRYNSLDDLTEEELSEREEELGWKQVHGDVFRVPPYAKFIPVLTGTGIQLLCMTLITLVLACAGLLSPANRGGLMTAFLVLFVLMGIPAGYVGSRLHKMFGLEDWKRNATRIAVFFPGAVFSIFFVLDLAMWYMQSKGAVPFGTLVALLALWLGVSFPLTLSGAYMGSRRPTIEPPVRVNHLARAIPEDQPWFLSTPAAALFAGVIPFGAVFVEMFFIMSSIWEHQFYYMFGILAIIFLILVITCAEVSIFVIYHQLANENYHWWWRAFMSSGSSALYMAGYSVYYFCTTIQIVGFIPATLFFGYMALACFAFFLLTGTIGFLASLWFVRKIYATIKID